MNKHNLLHSEIFALQTYVINNNINNDDGDDDDDDDDDDDNNNNNNSGNFDQIDNRPTFFLLPLNVTMK